jgi:hypothetical protein
VRALLLFALLVVFCIALMLASPHCADPNDCSNALARNGRWIAGVIGGGVLITSVVLWRMVRSEAPRPPRTSDRS